MSFLGHKFGTGKVDGIELFAGADVENEGWRVAFEVGFEIGHGNEHFGVVGLALLQAREGFVEIEFILSADGGQGIIEFVGAGLASADVEGGEEGAAGPGILIEEGGHGEVAAQFRIHGRTMAAGGR